MTWLRLDDQAWRNPKLLALSPSARLLWYAGLSFVAGNWPTNGGAIDLASARALARMQGVSAACITELITAGRWEETDDAFVVHDVSAFLPSALLLDQRRAAGRLGGLNSRSNQPASAQANRNQVTPARARRVDPTQPNLLTKSPNGDSSSSPSRIDAQAVWDAWVEATGKTRTKLDDKRRRLIQARLREFPVADLIAAVRGWRHDPWPDRARQNGIEILLRDAAHVEKFRDLEVFTDLSVPLDASTMLTPSIADLYRQRRLAAQGAPAWRPSKR